MKLTNTYISKDCTRKVLMYVDKNGHYYFRRIFTESYDSPLEEISTSRTYKHIESAQRAVTKWIK